MKDHKKISRRLRTRVWFCLVCLLACNFILSFNVKADQKVDWEGKWGDAWERSIPTSPIAFYNEAYLYIETTSTRSDITIRIVKDGNILYEETLYSPQTAITIALDFLDPGTYRLELTNQWGDFLYGTFEK